MNESKRPYISDSVFFELMMATVFGSGIKSNVVEKKWDCILSHFSDFREVAKYDEQKLSDIYSDPDMLRNLYKISAIVYNANHMLEVISTFGSMDQFIKSFELSDCKYDEYIMVVDLSSRFKFFGEVTSLRFLESIYGMN